MTGQGGWPMSVFLTPDRQALLRRHLLPADAAARHAVRSARCCEAIDEAWRASARRGPRRSASSIVRPLVDAAVEPRRAEQLTAADCARTSIVLLQREFDPTHGGFGGAPKFPPSMVLEALLRAGGEAGDADGRADAARRWRAAASTTSSAAASPATASTRGWVVPHFEKMLYDNALLLGAYAHWWRRTRDPLAERWSPRRSTGCCARCGPSRARSRPAWTPTRKTITVSSARVPTTSGTVISSWSVLGDEDAAWAAEVFAVTATGTFEHGASTLQLRSDP